MDSLQAERVKKALDALRLTSGILAAAASGSGTSTGEDAPLTDSDAADTATVATGR